MTDGDHRAREDSESTAQGADLTPLHLAAIGLHESFLAYTAAGFTEDQALDLIAKMVMENRRPRDD